jgi:hypothetical protein
MACHPEGRTQTKDVLKRVLKIIFRPKNRVTAGWRTLHNEGSTYYWGDQMSEDKICSAYGMHEKYELHTKY